MKSYKEIKKLVENGKLDYMSEKVFFEISAEVPENELPEIFVQEIININKNISNTLNVLLS